MVKNKKKKNISFKKQIKEKKPREKKSTHSFSIGKYFKNSKISKKLITGFLIVSIITTVVGAVGVLGFKKISDAENQLYEYKTQPVIHLSYMLNSLNSMQIHLREGIISAGKTQAIESSEKGFNEEFEKFQTSLENYKLKLNADELKNISTLESIINNFYIQTAEKAFDLAKKGNLTDAYVASQSISSSVDFVFNYLNENLNNRVYDAKTANAANADLSNLLSIVLIAVTVSGIIISIFIGKGVAKIISEPINSMVAAANKLTEGDTEIDINIDTNDEIKNLANAFNEVIIGIKKQVDYVYKIAEGDLTFDITPRSEKDILEISLKKTTEMLSQIVKDISEASTQVLAGANELSFGSQSLSQGAAEQASTIEELSASINEISAQIYSNNENVQEAEKYVKSAEDAVLSSDKQMKNMLTSMTDINKSSSEIAKIIKVIDDIAFQTNILALNAAVEAARAGAAGKGFAVVADEVRNLASKSAEAAKQTTILIENSINKVHEGSKIAENTALHLRSIKESTDLVVETINKISLASNEQTVSINQINQGLEQISTVVQTNSASAEESAAACEELSGQATLLKEQISLFKLKG